MNVFKKAKQSRLGSWCAGHKLPALLIAIGLVVVLAGGTTAACLTVSYYNSILPQGASFQGVDLGGMDEKKVAAVVEEQINPKLDSAKVAVNFNGQTQELAAKDYHFRFEPAEVFAAAKNCDYKNGQTPNPEIKYDKDAFNQAVSGIADATILAPTASSYEQKQDQLIVRAGAPGQKMKVEPAQQAVVSSMQTMSFAAVDGEAEAFTDDTVPINLEKIHGEVAHDVVNASYSVDASGLLSYQEEAPGIAFDLEQAKQAVTDPNQGEYTIPLTTTQPTVTIKQLKAEHANASCPNLLSTYTTKFSAGAANRNFNIARAASAINGTVLYPGEAFSALRLIGNASAADGYKDAAVYTPKGVEQGAGGGVCQVSTTAYLAALYGYFDITERHNHSYTVGYVPLGFDAAFSAGGTDMRFKNNRTNPVKVVASTTATSITVSIYGTPSDFDNYEVTMTSDVVSKTEERTSVVAHKTVTKDGQVVEEKDIKSTYKAIPKTQPASASSTPQSSAASAPSQPAADPNAPVSTGSLQPAGFRIF